MLFVKCYMLKSSSHKLTSINSPLETFAECSRSKPVPLLEIIIN